MDVPAVIIADAAYPLLPWLLKGYPMNEATKSQRLFNYRLARARMTVENTFGRKIHQIHQAGRHGYNYFSTCYTCFLYST